MNTTFVWRVNQQEATHHQRATRLSATPTNHNTTKFWRQNMNTTKAGKAAAGSGTIFSTLHTVLTVSVKIHYIYNEKVKTISVLFGWHTYIHVHVNVCMVLLMNPVSFVVHRHHQPTTVPINNNTTTTTKGPTHACCYCGNQVAG